MSSVAEMTGVFAALASYLHNTDSASPTVREHEERSLDVAISKLNGSLNLDDGGGGGDPAVQFLDTALSLMCFTAPQVFDSVLDRLLKTVTAALSSSVSCKLLKFQNAEALQIGSSISERDRGEVIEACNDVLIKLNENGVSGMHSHMLLDAVTRAAFSAARCQYFLPIYPDHNAKPARCRNSAALALLKHLPREFCLEKDEIPLRLLLWYLDPLVLKHEVSEILRETTERPFMYLNQEFHKRTDWRMIITCLVLCPVTFSETRALLHKWFLETGAAPLLELLIELVAVMLDVSSRPTWWGISTELGLKLPFSCAYFPFKHHVYKTLAGPITCSSFLDLVRSTCDDSVTNRMGMKVSMIDHRSAWALAITFPTWYYYASISLFHGQVQENMGPLPSSTSGARYISWVLDPINEIHREHLFDCLVRSSESWVHRQSACGERDRETSVSRKKLKKPKFSANLKSSLQENLQSPVSWLEKFESSCETFWPRTSGSWQQQSLMFRSIPLGILIGGSGDIHGDTCELLLYYAATGRIFQSNKTGFVGQKDSRKGPPGLLELAVWINECDREDAVTGACVVFRLTDIVESMSGSLCETEESRIDFVSQFKGRAYSFLAKCIKRLMSELNAFEDGSMMVSDLKSRLSRWKNQGRELINVRKDLDDIIVRLHRKV